MRHGAQKNDSVSIANDPLMKVCNVYSPSCNGRVQLLPTSNIAAWKIISSGGIQMTPGTLVQSMSTGVGCTPSNALLRNMIAQDVNQVTKKGVEDYITDGSKTTRVASLPDGTVQITFRRMIQADQPRPLRPAYNVPILPMSLMSETRNSTATATITTVASVTSTDLTISTQTPGERKLLPTSMVWSTASVFSAASVAASYTPTSTQNEVSSQIITNGEMHNSNNFKRRLNGCHQNMNFEKRASHLSFGDKTSSENPSCRDLEQVNMAVAGMSCEGAGMGNGGIPKYSRKRGNLVNTCPSRLSPISSSVIRPSVGLQERNSVMSEERMMSPTALEEELSKDLQDMCPTLFSPLSMDVDNFSDTGGFFGDTSSLSDIFYPSRSPAANYQPFPNCNISSVGSMVNKGAEEMSSLTQNIRTLSSGDPELIRGHQSQNHDGNVACVSDQSDIFSKIHDNDLSTAIRVACPPSVIHQERQSCSPNALDAGYCLSDVVDISPELYSSQGGGKIIIIGSWNDKDASYSCCFGEICVPAELVQHGVVRCFCPAHPAGKVPLSIFKDNHLVSKPATFEYVDVEEETDDSSVVNHNWLAIDEIDLRKRLIERIDAIQGVIDSSGSLVDKMSRATMDHPDLEDILCDVCEALSTMEFSLSHLPHNIENSMTVLHFAAALGFTRLIQALCSWTDSENSNSIIVQEADPTKRDQFGWIPLFWACANGRFDTVCVLLQWDETTSRVRDRCNCTSLSIVKEQNHTMLLKYLERFRERSSSREKSKNVAGNLSALRLLHSPADKHSLSSNAGEASPSEDATWDTASASCEGRLPGLKLNDSFSLRSYEGSSAASRTLGKTLAHVQAIIQDTKGDPDRSNPGSPSEYVTSDEESLFDVPPFTPSSRSRNLVDENRGTMMSTPHSSVSSLSPGSPSQGGTAHSPFDPASHDTAEFCEFFYNARKILEKDFAELTLTDQEQQELFRAASIIQKAYKEYRERRKRRDHELQAATLIQSYYRRYKQYASFKKMQKGALLIQSQFRAHREERKKSKAASIIQTYYRRYKERKDSKMDIQERNRAKQDAERRASRFLKQNSSRLLDFSVDFSQKM